MQLRQRHRQGGQGAERDAHRLRSGLIWTCALGLMLLSVSFAVPDLRSVVERATDAKLGWLAVAVALEIGSCLGYVATVRLVLRRGPAREIRWLAWAETAFGAVVPVGGAGGLVVGAWAMREWGVAWSRIANRSAVIFLLTSAVNAAVLAVGGLGVSLGLGGATTPRWYGLLPAGVALVGLVLFMALPWLTRGGRASRVRWLRPILTRTAAWVADTEAVAFTPNWRLLGAVGYLVLDIGALWACLWAVGARPPLMAIVVGYQIGYLANLVPVPGGIGVLDGGLLGALVLYGLPPAETAAAIILYHAISLWVPALGGTASFVRLRASVAAGSPLRGAAVYQATGAEHDPASTRSSAAAPVSSPVAAPVSSPVAAHVSSPVAAQVSLRCRLTA